MTITTITTVTTSRRHDVTTITTITTSRRHDHHDHHDRHDHHDPTGPDEQVEQRDLAAHDGSRRAAGAALLPIPACASADHDEAERVHSVSMRGGIIPGVSHRDGGLGRAVYETSPARRRRDRRDDQGSATRNVEEVVVPGG